MSESINLKVVIFWSIFIFVFAGLGIFGATNQDLLEDKAPDVYVPIVQSDNNITCTVDKERGNITYLFSLDENDLVKNVRISYTAVDGTVEDYVSADNLKNMIVGGVNTDIQNEINNFTLMLFMNLNNLDHTAITNYQADADALSIVIDGPTEYEAYKQLIETKTPGLTCEKEDR